MLWAPELSTISIKHNLDYLIYQGVHEPDQKYWGASVVGKPTAMSMDGSLFTVPSESLLPALCT